VEKFQAFGWECVEIDGHNTQLICDTVRNRSGTKPLMVIARTVKGKGVSYMENVPMWHYRSPNKDELRQAMQELE
jgi:transketolase